MYIVTNIGALRFLLASARGVPRWEVVLPLGGILVAGYTLYRNLWPVPDHPYDVFPYIVAAWLSLGAVAAFVVPGLARRAGRGTRRGTGAHLSDWRVASSERGTQNAHTALGRAVTDERFGDLRLRELFAADELTAREVDAEPKRQPVPRMARSTRWPPRRTFATRISPPSRSRPWTGRRAGGRRRAASSARGSACRGRRSRVAGRARTRRPRGGRRRGTSSRRGC